MSGRKRMHGTLKRLALAGALATTVGGAAPAAITATAAAAPAGATAFPFPDSLAFFPSVPGGVAANGQLIVGPAATGAVIITTAPTSFINTNNQISAGGNWSAGQVVAP